MRYLTLFLSGLVLACLSAAASDRHSFEGTLIGNPPQAPSQCKILADLITLERDNSGDLYYLYECRDSGNSAKFLRLWRLRVETDKSIRVVNEIILNKPAKTKTSLSIYSCSIKNESEAVAAGILPYHNSRDDLMVKKALGFWRVKESTLESLSLDKVETCQVLRC